MPGQSYRILIADDNLVNHKLIQRILAKMNHKVVSVYNGYEVLQSLQYDQFDFILMDIQMPELDGLMTTSQIIATFGPINRPVIIAMTANNTISDREECFRAGMDDYLSKPIIIKELEDKLDYWGRQLGKDRRQMKKLPALDHRQNQVISLLRIHELRSFEPDQAALLELYEVFISRCQTQLQKLQHDWIQNNIEGMRESSHGLRGSSLNYGAIQVAELLELLEDRLQSGHLHHIPDLLNQLKASVDITNQEIIAFIQSSCSSSSWRK